jgi:hypothetical protein
LFAKAVDHARAAPRDHENWIHGLALSPEGRYLATANPNGTVYVLPLAEPESVYQVPPAADPK